MKIGGVDFTGLSGDLMKGGIVPWMTDEQLRVGFAHEEAFFRLPDIGMKTG